MAMDDEARDVNGAAVRVGTRVRVLEISPSVLSQLPQSEADCAQSMQGEVFEVYEIDEWGGAWVEKLWKDRDGTSVVMQAIGWPTARYWPYIALFWNAACVRPR